MIFEQITFAINQNFTFCHPLFSIVADRQIPHKTGFCVFTCASVFTNKKRALTSSQFNAEAKHSDQILHG
jgi:hypothetical protein